jgi:Leucine-rich repeat (LRR) protein
MSVLQLKNCNLQTQPDLSRSQATRLSFSGNSIATFFTEYLPPNLEYLDLGNNYLADDGIPFVLPDSIEELLLDSNNIYNLEGIHWPQSLRKLMLDNNCIRALPEGLPNTLEKLSVRHTNILQIHTLPPTLKELIINFTLLNKLPRRIHLEVLEAHTNHIHSIGLPFDWGMRLRSLNLSNNRLTQFPSNLPESLEQLHLQYNQIEVVPSLPSNLQVLTIGYNKVKTIIFKKRKTPLTYVQLTNNQLTFSVIEVQISHPDNLWARSIDESHNWSNITYHLTSNLIKRVWRRYRLKKTLRAWLKTARVKEELIARAMHPSRYGQFEDLTPMKV